MTDSPLVSIALVTRNGAATLPSVLGMLSRQRVDFPFEVIAVDSGSTDGSVDVLARSVDRVVAIEPGTFDHGLTRNLAVERARADLVVFLVQDALPADDLWLAHLTAPLRADERVAGSFARQVPHADASAITRHYLKDAVVSGREPLSLLPLTPEALAGLEPIERLRRCTFDNVCSCIRRSVWQQIPFRSTPIGEDLEWAKAVLLAGFRLEYVASAVVHHSHERSPWYELARTYTLHRRLFELFELRTIPSLPHLIRAAASSFALHRRLERERPVGFARAAGLACAWPAGQYFGAMAAANGWKRTKLGDV